MTQRVKRAERKRRQRERWATLLSFAERELRRWAGLPPMRPEDCIFRSSGKTEEP